MHIEKISSDKEKIWDEYVAGHPRGTLFHRAAWRDVIRDSAGHTPHYLMAVDEDCVCGVLPIFVLNTGIFGKMAVSLPFLNIGGMLADSLKVQNALAEESESLARDLNLRYVELRQAFDLDLDLPVSDRKVVSTISLDGGSEAVFSRLHQNVRNKIRKSGKNDVVIDKGSGYLDEFYAMYSRNLRDLGTPVISKKFFKNILDAFPGEAHIYIARRKGELIGAKLVFFDQQTCYFVWAASRKDRMKYAPVQALNWAAIEDACEKGCASVDLGRSTRDSSHQNFKKYWGVEVKTLPWSYQLIGDSEMPGLNPDNPKFALAVKIWRRLPLCFTRIIGPALARRLP